MEWRARGDSTALLPHARAVVYAVQNEQPTETRNKLSAELRAEVVECSKTQSLRHLALEYGISHEAIRSVVRDSTTKPLDGDSRQALA